MSAISVRSLTKTFVMVQGTLEPIWLTPTRRETFVLGYGLASGLVSLAGSLILIVGGSIFFRVNYAAGLALAAPAVALAALSIVGVAYLASAAVLLLKEPNFAIDVSSFLFAALSGVLFPVLLLPLGIRLIALALPTTYARST